MECGAKARLGKLSTHTSANNDKIKLRCFRMMCIDRPTHITYLLRLWSLLHIFIDIYNGNGRPGSKTRAKEACASASSHEPHELENRTLFELVAEHGGVHWGPCHGPCDVTSSRAPDTCSGNIYNIDFPWDPEAVMLRDHM
eukprot:2927703-Amphidinium_carterae.1